MRMGYVRKVCVLLSTDTGKIILLVFGVRTEFVSGNETVGERTVGEISGLL